MAALPKADIKLIVGLGNPGSQYDQTRHNAGAWCVERVAQDYNSHLAVDTKHHGRIARINKATTDCWLLLPTTFMNLSGQSVLSLSQYYKIAIENILVVHDELDLPPGVAKLKFGGGHGGHNGLRDIIQKLGGKKDFYRLRVGIGHPGDKSLVHNFVLGKPPKNEKEKIDLAIDESLRNIPTLLDGDLSKAMNRLHQFSA